MIQVKVEPDDIAKAITSLAPQMIRWQDKQLMIAVKQKTVALKALKLSLQTEIAYDQLRADMICRLEEGHLHLEAELK